MSEVGSDADHWALAPYRDAAGDISFGVDFQVLESMRASAIAERLGAGFLLERRSSDLGQRDDSPRRPVVLGGEGRDRLAR